MCLDLSRKIRSRWLCKNVFLSVQGLAREDAQTMDMEESHAYSPSSFSVFFCILLFPQQTPDVLPVGEHSIIPAEPRSRSVEARWRVSNHCGLPATRGAGVPATGLLQVWRRRGKGRELLHCAPAGNRYCNNQLRQTRCF